MTTQINSDNSKGAESTSEMSSRKRKDADIEDEEEEEEEEEEDGEGEEDHHQSEREMTTAAAAEEDDDNGESELEPEFTYEHLFVVLEKLKNYKHKYGKVPDKDTLYDIMPESIRSEFSQKVVCIKISKTRKWYLLIVIRYGKDTNFDSEQDKKLFELCDEIWDKQEAVRHRRKKSSAKKRRSNPPPLSECNRGLCRHWEDILYEQFKLVPEEKKLEVERMRIDMVEKMFSHVLEAQTSSAI